MEPKINKVEYPGISDTSGKVYENIKPLEQKCTVCGFNTCWDYHKKIRGSKVHWALNTNQ